MRRFSTKLQELWSIYSFECVFVDWAPSKEFGKKIAVETTEVEGVVCLLSLLFQYLATVNLYMRCERIVCSHWIRCIPKFWIFLLESPDSPCIAVSRALTQHESESFSNRFLAARLLEQLTSWLKFRSGLVCSNRELTIDEPKVPGEKFIPRLASFNADTACWAVEFIT